MLDPSAKEWTIMVYIAGADNMSDAARDALLQMKEVGSTKHFDLLVQFDTGSEGPTKRYHLKPLRGSEAEKAEKIAKIEEARRVLSALDKDSLGKLADGFKELLDGEGSEARKQQKFNDMNLTIGGEEQRLKSFLEALLIGPEEQKCFANKLANERERKKLASDPFFLIPFAFDCLLKDDSVPFKGSTSTGDPLVLRKFLEWGTTLFPSRHKMVVIMGHGDGMSVAWDATPGSLQTDPDLNRLRAVELREAFSIPKKDEPACFEFFDIIGFNACLMGMVEVYHKLRHYVGIGIASEGPTPIRSWPYVAILRELQNQPRMTPRELAQTVFDECMREQEASGFEEWCAQNPEVTNKGECTIDLSICNLGRVQDVVSHLGNLADLLKQLVRDSPRNILDAREESQTFFNGDYVDLYDFCQKLQTHFKSQPLVAEACDKLIEALYSMVLDQRHLDRAPHSHGLSVYFPDKRLPRRYSTSLRIKEIDWDDFLRSYVKLEKGTVLEVDSGTKRVTLEMAELSALKLTVDDKTKIRVGGKPGRLADLKEGQEAAVEDANGMALKIRDNFFDSNVNLKKCKIKSKDSTTNSVILEVVVPGKVGKVALNLDNTSRIRIGGKPGRLDDLPNHKAVVEREGDKAISIEC